MFKDKRKIHNPLLKMKIPGEAQASPGVIYIKDSTS